MQGLYCKFARGCWISVWLRYDIEFFMKKLWLLVLSVCSLVLAMSQGGGEGRMFSVWFAL